jgi:hypothetical protein
MASLAKTEEQEVYLNKTQLLLLLLAQVVCLSIIQHIFQFEFPYEVFLAQALELEYLYLGKCLHDAEVTVDPISNL